MSVPGIDYGRGMTNIDTVNDIRYGVISQHDVSQAWSESSEPDYGPPCCPECGNDITDYAEDSHGEYEQFHNRGCADHACEHCELTLDSSDCYSDEAIGWNLDDGEYQASDCLDSDIIIMKSPYYTHACFCSPCVPGAGNLNSDDPDGVKTYCFGHDWFEDGKAPYPVYSVADDSEVLPV